MKRLVLPALSGVLFGTGLVLAGMTRPGKVVGFLDVAGDWDPSLAFVMGGAIAVHGLAYLWRRRMAAPWSGGGWSVPTRRDVDLRLVAGAAIFGAGWGLGGICPGPGLASIGTGSSSVFSFLVAMLAGMALFEAFNRASEAAPARAQPQRACTRSDGAP